MAFTIYTVSDPATVGSVMTSMAMFFGQDSWVGSLVKLGLIISLLVIMAKGVLAREGLRLDVLLMQLVVIWVMFIPKTTVTIEQFENNAPVRVVDDVPYAIALPGAVAGSFALFMTSKIETVMSGVDGKYIKPSGEIDPFAPAKALMRIASAPLDPARHMDVNLMQTLHNAARVCGGKDTQTIRFENEKDGFTKFADSLTTPGVVTIYNDSFPYRDSGGAGEFVTCDVARAEIAGVGAQLAANGLVSFEKTLNGIAETTLGQRYSDNHQSATNLNTWADLLPILNRVAPATAQLTSLAVANVMSYSVLSQTARNSKTAVDEIMEIQRDTGLFQWAKDESMQALMVSTTAPKFMDILFFIFIAATPIVMFVVVANPASGIKVAGAYVLFGLWTQSWIPMMAIISGWYQAEIKNFASPGVNGLTPEYLSALMRHVSTSTIAASNMLQSAPYMMFAIMTGSMFAMSSMVSKAAPSAAAMGGGAGAGGAGESGGAGSSPFLAKGGSGAAPSGVQQAAALAAAQAAVAGGGAFGQGAFKGSNNISSAVGAGALGSFSNQGAVDAAVQHTDQKALEAAQAVETASSNLFAEIFAAGAKSSNGLNASRVTSNMRSSGYDVADNFFLGRGNTAADGAKATKGANSDTHLKWDGGAYADVNLAGIMKAFGAIAGKKAAQSGASQIQKGAASNVASLANKAEQAYAAGDTANGDKFRGQAEKAAAKYDAEYGGKGGGIASTLGDIVSSTLRAGVKGGITTGGGNGEQAGAVQERGGARQDRVGHERNIAAKSGNVKQSGATANEGASYARDASKIEQLNRAVQESQKDSLSAKQAKSAAETARESRSAGSAAQLDGAAIAQAYSDNRRGPASQTDGQAMSRILGDLAPTLGSQVGGFDRAMREAYGQLLRATNGGNGMDKDQLAAAAAVKALGAMSRSGNSEERMAGFAGAAAMAQMGGLGGVLNNDVLQQAATIAERTNTGIAKGEKALEKPMSDLTRRAEKLDPDNTRDFVSGVLGAMQKDKGTASGIQNESRSGAGHEEGLRLGQQLLNSPEAKAIIAEKDPVKAAEMAKKWANDLSTAPTQANNYEFIAGKPDPTSAKAEVGNFANDLVMKARELVGGGEAAAPAPGSSAGTHAAGGVMQVIDGTTGAGINATTVVTGAAAPAGGSADATPGMATTGNGGGTDLTTNNNGGPVQQPVGAPGTTAKPNSSPPAQNAGKPGKGRVQGRS